MASACVNNIGVSPDSFLECPGTFPSFGWLSPRISFSREEEASKSGAGAVKSPSYPAAARKPADLVEGSDPEVFCNDIGDFEFRLEDPVNVLPADELFSDGKLMPLHLSMIRPAETTTVSSQISSPDTPKPRRRTMISGSDPYLFSPKAPRCSSRWKELLGLKKLYHSSNVKQDNNHKTMSSSAPSHALSTAKSLKHFLHRSSKSTGAALDSSLSLPLLKDTDNESVSISSRLSLSSSSSGHDLDDLPRLSLDSDKPQKSLNLNLTSIPPRIRLVKPRAVSMDNAAAARVSRSPLRRQQESANATGRGVSVDSPRMNSYGKIVFHSLERSSSSPSSFNGGPRFKHRGMERSYSANVRVTPVLNVPVCSLRGSSKFGFPMFSSQQRRDGGAGVGNGSGSRSQHSNNSKNRTDRT